MVSILFSACDAVSASVRTCLALQLLVLHLRSCHSNTTPAGSVHWCPCVVMLRAYCSLTLLRQHVLPACLPVASATSESAWVCQCVWVQSAAV